MAIDRQSLKRTLLVYIAYALLICSVLTIIVLLAEYTPSPGTGIKRFGIGALTLNSILWSFLFAIAGSTSIFNQYKQVHNNFLLSLLSFILLPSVLTIVILMIVRTEFFAFPETTIVYFISQLFLFFRFRSCLKRPNITAIE